MRKETRQGGISLLSIFVIFAVIFGVFFVWNNYGDVFKSLFGIKKVDQEPLAIVQPTSVPPTPKLTPHPIVQGKETYTIGQGSTARPKIRSLEIDPHDPKVNETQTLKARVVDTQPVQSVKVLIGNDNGTKEFDLKLTEGTNLDGKWTISWTVDNTVLYSYYFTIDAIGTGAKSTVTVSIR